MKALPKPVTHADKLKRILGRSEDEQVTYVDFRPRTPQVMDASRVLHALFGDKALWNTVVQDGRIYRCREVDLSKAELSFEPFEKGFETLMQCLWADDKALLYQKNMKFVIVRVPAEMFPNMQEMATAMLQVPLVKQGHSR
jgi:hypothetical protein